MKAKTVVTYTLSRCVKCLKCVKSCPTSALSMEQGRILVNPDRCINCGECMSVCPTGAIQWKGSKPFLAPNAIDDNATLIEKQDFEAQTKKIARRNKTLKIVSAVLMTALLAAALIYYNIIDKPTPPVTTPTETEAESASQDETSVPVGNKVGNRCPGYDAPLFDRNGPTGETFNPAENIGKITVINFWGTWCGGCVKELPDFDRIASDYKDTVTVIALHSDFDYDTAAAFVDEKFPDSAMLFGKDELTDPDDPYSPDKYFTALGGTDSYPITLVLDEEGVIIASIMKETNYNELKDIIEAQLRS